ncbi:MAG: Yip1 family protein [Candidatus Margulisiibacteriota bacterium]
MKILERVREMILNPKITWEGIKEEEIEIRQFFINYAAPLALIPAVSSFVGITIIGLRLPDGAVMRAPFLEALVGSTGGYALNLAAVFAVAWAIKLLAPLFGAKADLSSAAKVVVYSMTPVWLVGVFSLIPGLGILSILGLYGIYLLALGLKTVLDAPSDRLALYTISGLAVGVMVSFIFSLIIVSLFYGPMYLRMLAV